jgi:hypothetical protein
VKGGERKLRSSHVTGNIEKRKHLRLSILPDRRSMRAIPLAIGVVFKEN